MLLTYMMTLYHNISLSNGATRDVVINCMDFQIFSKIFRFQIQYGSILSPTPSSTLILICSHSSSLYWFEQ